VRFFIVYKTDDGRVLRSGCCQDEMFDAQAMAPNEGVMEGVIPRGSPEDIFVDLSGDTPRLITEGE